VTTITHWLDRSLVLQSYHNVKIDQDPRLLTLNVYASESNKQRYERTSDGVELMNAFYIPYTHSIDEPIITSRDTKMTAVEDDR